MPEVDEKIVKEKNDTATGARLKRTQEIPHVQDETGEQVDQVLTIIESVEVDPRLTKFAEMYNRWSAISKSRLDWSRVQVAMLANDGAILKQAEAIPNGPIMFGADQAGNILFANGGVEPILTGYIYTHAKEQVDSLGLGLFPAAIYEPRPSDLRYKKSEEILMFEEFAGHPIVASEDRKTWASIWLESGREPYPIRATVANFDPKSQVAYVEGDYSTQTQGAAVYDFGLALDPNSSFRGVRVLLRAKA